MLKVAVAGGNITASTVLSLLRTEPDVKIVGLLEKNSETPGAALARKWAVPVYDDVNILVTAADPEIIINMTGDTRISETIRVLFKKVEVVDANGGRLLWKTIEKQKKAVAELFRAIEDQKRFILLTESLSSTESLQDFMRQVLDSALEIADCPAGSIALVDGQEMQLISSKGLSRRFTDNDRWSVMAGGLTDLVLKKRETVALPDLSKVNYANNAVLMGEGIMSVLASPIILDGAVFGIIYLDDFRPRPFSERQKRAISLLSRVCVIIRERRLTEQRAKAQEKELAGLKERSENGLEDRVAELEKMNRELEDASRLKSHFITTMNHELRTPLNSIIGFADVLAGKGFGDLTESQERYVRNITTAGKHLLELINNCLDIAKIESGRFDMTIETFPVVSVMSEVFNTTKPLADRRTLDFTLSIGEGVETVTADRVKLKQILYNLISNAVKFTPEGGKIGLQAEMGDRDKPENQRSIIFSVWDTGIGIRPEDSSRIFEEFEQVDSALSRQYEGAGLGLALVKKLVELHGGLISLESRPGEGSTFSFTIPSVTQLPAEELAEAEPLDFEFPWMEEKAPLILVVEDDVASAELLTLHLSQAGYKVAHAYDGEEAIEKARSLRPFAIMLDIMLPRRDGWEILQVLKEDVATAAIPVLIHSVIDNKELAFALGATDYLLKPLDKEALINRLQSLSITGCKKCPMTVLVIEPTGEIESLREAVASQDVLLYSAREGRRGIELASALMPSIIFLDFELSDMLGFDVVNALKENQSTRNIPIFILTERDISVEDRLNYVGKIERIIRKHRFNAEELVEHIMEIEVLFPRKAGLLDELTGIFSHRYFQIRLAQEVERATRYKQPLNLLILDIDFFGAYVRANGEAAGDEALRKVSEILRKNIRGSDVVVRYGGDAFAILLPNTVVAAALALGNRYTAIIKNYPFANEADQPKGRITASAGLVFLDGQTPEELELCAQKALSQAIRRGGDRVEIYSKELDEAEALPHA